MSERSPSDEIRERLKRRIEAGELSAGSLLQSEHELAQESGVGRSQARKALLELELEGYIIRSKGKRSVVAPPENRRVPAGVVGNENVVAIALPEYYSIYLRCILNALISRLSREGYQTIAYHLKLHDGGEVRFLRQVRASGVRGLAIWVQQDDEEVCAELQAFREIGFPFVLIDRYVRGVATDFVVSDNEAFGYHLTRSLIKRGHKKIGHAMGPMMMTSAEDRFAGYRRALEEAGLSYDERFTRQLPLRDRDGMRAVVNETMAFRDRASAFFCNNDAVARELAARLMEMGYRMPEDVELATVDDEHFPILERIPMIFAGQRANEMGDQAAEVLIARIREPKRELDQRFLGMSEE